MSGPVTTFTADGDSPASINAASRPVRSTARGAPVTTTVSSRGSELKDQNACPRAVRSSAEAGVPSGRVGKHNAWCIRSGSTWIGVVSVPSEARTPCLEKVTVKCGFSATNVPPQSGCNNKCALPYRSISLAGQMSGKVPGSTSAMLPGLRSSGLRWHGPRNSFQQQSPQIRPSPCP